jgi:hypothetical protein
MARGVLPDAYIVNTTLEGKAVRTGLVFLFPFNHDPPRKPAFIYPSYMHIIFKEEIPTVKDEASKSKGSPH